tara:strand:+ start:16725 stop:16919 length:195 start_codon:yes stop_codon:yes gene_type:complete
MIAKPDREIADSILNPEWDPTELSFSVLQYLRLDPDLMQLVLETRSTFERLTLIWEIVEQGERS